METASNSIEVEMFNAQGVRDDLIYTAAPPPL